MSIKLFLFPQAEELENGVLASSGYSSWLDGQGKHLSVHVQTRAQIFLSVHVQGREQGRADGSWQNPCDVHTMQKLKAAQWFCPLGGQRYPGVG
ncbi:hypothetical protein ElyMa_000595000 [Elysia marginata]|uniref:Uncharacterized protein n=1 Tax=Elysia marginata TaxID=1093978 RepID=A0AAV4G5R6_9GAST|nr:hypothetical protein ElyMa_000595000 [Elysia marginata]